jgi:hypothetical protein
MVKTTDAERSFIKEAGVVFQQTGIPPAEKHGLIIEP